MNELLIETKLVIHDIQEVPLDWCPITDPLPEGLFAPITVRKSECSELR